jgi:FixJ family two-component response regulator
MAIGSGRKVFVVEDDESMRGALENLLDAAGYETAVYASAEELLAEGVVSDAACIISDIKLPGMSGLELLTKLRARGAGPPVIIITAHDAPTVRDEAERRGAVAYLPKPFPGSAVLAAIESATGTAMTK